MLFPSKRFCSKLEKNLLSLTNENGKIKRREKGKEEHFNYFQLLSLIFFSQEWERAKEEFWERDEQGWHEWRGSLFIGPLPSMPKYHIFLMKIIQKENN
jgi:hypothetical protein